MTLFRRLTCLWPSVPNEPKTTILLFGGVVELGRHFRCAWNSWSFDIFTRRAYVCLSQHGLDTYGEGMSEVGTMWALRSRLEDITIHAGFIGIVSFRFTKDGRERSRQALERAEVKPN